MDARTLAKVRQATVRRDKARAAWKRAIREAVQEHAPLRAVGDAAGISHVHVLRIVRGE